MSDLIIGMFRRWLVKQRHREDSVGDFANDFLVDDCARNIRTLSGIDWHLRHVHHADNTVLSARDRAWREYKTYTEKCVANV